MSYRAYSELNIPNAAELYLARKGCRVSEPVSYFLFVKAACNILTEKKNFSVLNKM